MNDSTRRGFLTTGLVGLAAASTVASEQDAPSAVEKALTDARRKAEEDVMQTQAAYGKALIARFGAGVVDVIQETTIARARASLSSAKVPKRDLDAVKSLLWDRIGEPFQHQLVERTPRTMRFKVTRCPYAERMRMLDAAELGFAYYCAYDYGFCEGLNPAIQFTRTKTLMQGADCCDHAYQLDQP